LNTSPQQIKSPMFSQNPSVSPSTSKQSNNSASRNFPLTVVNSSIRQFHFFFTPSFVVSQLLFVISRQDRAFRPFSFRRFLFPFSVTMSSTITNATPSSSIRTVLERGSKLKNGEGMLEVLD
jgi:hypothetical protein